MNDTDAYTDTAPPQAFSVLTPRLIVAPICDLLPVMDFAVVGTLAMLAAPGLARFAMLTALLAPFVLWDRRFTELARTARIGRLAGMHALRFATLLVAAAVLGTLARAFTDAPGAALLAWIAAAALATAATRLSMAVLARRPGPDGASVPPASAGEGPFAPRVLPRLADHIQVHVLAHEPIARRDALIKAAADLVVSTALVALLLPVLAAIAAAIKLTSPGPVFFTQRRHAINNREFDVLKFRTMRWKPEPAGVDLQQTLRDDARITPIGRLLRAASLDELPQLFNVLKGDMSLVGPRPHAVNMRTEGRLGCEITDDYPHRHRVRPGITGWSQVNGARGATDTQAQLLRRVQLDLHYIENWSLWLDAKILARTAGAVMKRTNAF